MSINRVVISGNLTREPELRVTAGGTSILNLGVAVNDRRRCAASYKCKKAKGVKMLELSAMDRAYLFGHLDTEEVCASVLKAIEDCNSIDGVEDIAMRVDDTHSCIMQAIDSTRELLGEDNCKEFTDEAFAMMSRLSYVYEVTDDKVDKLDNEE